MPRIDPLSLLKCLSVLLGPTGGIKSKEEVNRLANLMTKFSKKLVSKCIYIQILKVTNSDLLSQFMAADGWKLIHSWLQDGIAAKNWELVQELLELLLLCPVDIERLKSNNCPKMVKGLSKEGQPMVKALASRLVEQWLKIVKGEAPPNSVPIQIATGPLIALPPQEPAVVNVNLTSNQMQMMDVAEPESCELQQQATTIKVQDFDVNNTDAVNENQSKFQEQIHIQPVQLQIVNKTIAGQSQPTQIKKQSFVVVTTTANHHNHHSPTVPVYKITIRDGKQVLTKVETDSANIKNLLINDSVKNNVATSDVHEDSINMSENNSVAIDNDLRTLNSNVSNDISGEVTQDKFNKLNNQVDNVDNNVILASENDNNHEENNDVKDLVNSEGNNKFSDKENLDSSHKKDDKSISSSNNNSSSNSSDKKSSSSHHSSRSSSKHSSNSSSRSSSHKSSHRSSSSKSSGSKSSSSRDRDRHHSSKHSSSSSGKSSRSEREKEREKEKEKMKKDQAEKDKATLEKIQGQGSLGTKFGKIPKKKPDDETGDSLRKSSTDSRDSSKENKDSKKVSGILEKKNISISIENRKNSQETSTQRPKTVKTFNSKFRSTGLEEEIKPPPPRTAGKKNSTAPISTAVASTDKKISSPKVQTLKRSSPLRETGASADKKPRLSLDTPSTPPLEDKKGAIKLIPPKPKPMVLQESDMFMDALMTASTKNKEPRKRKRRTSISKDSDAKKTDGSNSADAASRDALSPPSSSPQGGDDRSSLPVKPEFKFYQDTLETDEDKEEKDDELADEKTKDRMDEDDDDRSRTPTCEDEVEDPKAPASPDDLADAGRKDAAGSPIDDIRYVDGLRSVLLLQKRKGPKKNLKWKTELESVRYFELDETERVNVTKTFTDMKQMEKQGEREAFQMARKLSNEDTMEEKTRWTTLVPIDLPAPLVEPGKESREKDIQYAREKGILQALYFNRSMIPDSPAEPDEERHHIMADPKAIPLDDLTGNKESEKDFTSVPWPEPKPQLPPVAPIVQNIHFPTFPQHNPVIPGLPMPPGSLGMNSLPQPLSQQLPQPLMPPMNHMAGGVGDVGAGGWRTGDGKVVVPDVSMNNISANVPTNFPPPNMDPSMMPPNMMGPPGMYNQSDGYQGMAPNDDGNFGHMSNNFQGPAMFGPGNFQSLPPRGAQMNPMHGGNRGRGGPGWFRGNVAPMRGGWNNRGAGVGGNGGGGGGGGGGWRNNGKQPPICRQFTKTGYCRSGDKCLYLHPGVNYPPF